MVSMQNGMAVMQALKDESLRCFLLEEQKPPAGNGSSELSSCSSCGGGVLGPLLCLLSVLYQARDG